MVCGSPVGIALRIDGRRFVSTASTSRTRSSIEFLSKSIPVQLKHIVVYKIFLKRVTLCFNIQLDTFRGQGNGPNALNTVQNVKQFQARLTPVNQDPVYFLLTPNDGYFAHNHHCNHCIVADNLRIRVAVRNYVIHSKVLEC